MIVFSNENKIYFIIILITLVIYKFRQFKMVNKPKNKANAKSSKTIRTIIFGGKLDIEFNKNPFLLIVYQNGSLALGCPKYGFKYLEYLPGASGKISSGL